MVLRCEYRPQPRLREKFCTVNFDELELRKTTARGFRIADKDIAKFIQIKRGTSATGEELTTEEELPSGDTGGGR